jgi:hypothetical protein
MTELPAPLATWRKQLALFPNELAASLGSLVRTLAPALHAFTPPALAQQGEVDGFDGIANRGQLERLLASELAVGMRHPLEFLRRAATGEQAFLNLARRGPAHKTGSLLLLDAGPDQIGGCRIVQLAVLVILVQRAEARGEPLHWQILQHGDDPPRQGLNDVSVRAFLGARTGARSSPASVQSWQERYAGFRHWLMAAPELVEQCRTSFSVAARERVAPGATTIDVTLHAPGRVERELALELPAAPLAVRMLRDPFASAAPLASNFRAPRVASNLVLNSQGNRLFYRAVTGELVTLVVPNSLRAQPGKPRLSRAPQGTQVLALNTRGKRLIWLGAGDRFIALTGMPPRAGGPTVAVCHGPELKPGWEIWPLAPFPEDTLTFVAPDRALWRADFRSGVARPIGHGVRAVFTDNTSFWVALDQVSDDDPLPAPTVVGVVPFKLERQIKAGAKPVPTNERWRQVFLRQPHTTHESWLLAFEAPEGTWHLQIRSKTDGSVRSETILRPMAGMTTVGVDNGQGLFVLDDGRRELVRVSRSRTNTVLRTASPIVDFTVAGTASIFAYTTERGELTVADFNGHDRFRCTPESEDT